MPRNGASSGLRCVLTYHDMQGGTSKYLYRVSTQHFSEHLSFVSTFAANYAGRPEPEIVFDDGHISNYEVAFPILERHGIKATFFVVVGRIGIDKEFMNWEQARELLAAGHRVESHGWSHRLLTLCTPEDLQKELSSSKRELEDRLGKEVLAISAPGGRWNEKVVEGCATAGYRQLFHSNPWQASRAKGTIHLQGRHMVTRHTGVEAFVKWQTMSRQQVFLQRAKYGLKEHVRATLGDRLYHKLWSNLANWEEDQGIALNVEGNGKVEGEPQRP